MSTQPIQTKPKSVFEAIHKSLIIIQSASQLAIKILRQQCIDPRPCCCLSNRQANRMAPHTSPSTKQDSPASPYTPSLGKGPCTREGGGSGQGPWFSHGQGDLNAQFQRGRLQEGWMTDLAIGSVQGTKSEPPQQPQQQQQSSTSI